MQSETKAAGRRRRAVDRTKRQGKSRLVVGKVEIGTAGSVKAFVQQQQTGETQVLGKVLTPCT